MRANFLSLLCILKNSSMNMKFSNYVYGILLSVYIHQRIGIAKATSATWQGNNACSQTWAYKFIKTKWQVGTWSAEHEESPNNGFAFIKTNVLWKLMYSDLPISLMNFMTSFAFHSYWSLLLVSDVFWAWIHSDSVFLHLIQAETKVSTN